MKKLHIIICLMLLFNLSGCDKLNKKTNTFDLDISEDISLVDGKLSIEFKTNLPDETVGYIRVINKNSDFYNQSYSQVNHGRIKSPELFSLNEGPLPKGDYEIIFTLPPSSNQPERIIGILGSEYVNINSPYFTDGPSGKEFEYIVQWTID